MRRSHPEVELVFEYVRMLENDDVVSAWLQAACAR